jgi:hypothetical protein
MLAGEVVHPLRRRTNYLLVVEPQGEPQILLFPRERIRRLLWQTRRQRGI